MKARLARHEVARLLGSLHEDLSPKDAERLRRLADALDGDRRSVQVAKAHKLLFDAASSDATKNKGLTRLRDRLAEAVEERGLQLELCLSASRKAGAEGRELWFEGKAPSAGLHETKELSQIGEEEIRDLRGRPVTEPVVHLQRGPDGKPVVRIFICYAQKDRAPSKKLIEELKSRLKVSRLYSFETWQDVELLVGESWDERIHSELTNAHLGLVLLTPRLLGSKYIREVELPSFVDGRGAGVEGKRVVPVELRRIDFEHTDLQGLRTRQIYRGPRNDPSPFPGRAGDRQDRWMVDLVDQIHRLLERYGRTDEEPELPGTRQKARWTPAAEHMLGKDLEDLGSCVIEDAMGRATVLSRVLETSDQTGSVPAVDYLFEWLEEGKPELFALLGEYGMGKTITCQRFVRDIETRRETGAELPLPLYFDLRNLTGLRSGPVPTLNEVLGECIQRGWRLDDQKPEAAEVLEWARREPVLFVFDGLDEALVHLTEVDGKTFTRELLRVREVSAQGANPTTRILISCRSHYFRTLQDQNAHFTGQDRGGTSADDYRALVLLPLEESQVRGYLASAVEGLDADRALELIKSIHDLRELSGRPYTLKLLSVQIPELERLRAEGREVYGVTLYRLMVDQWLGRDGGKHHLKTVHKKELMRYLAAWTWERGTRLIPAVELEETFGEWLDSSPALRRRYGTMDLDKLEEDLRTATFLVREDSDSQDSGFRFAHSSIQEFFLAQWLFEAVRGDRPAEWRFEQVSRETWDFVVQLAREAGSVDLGTRLTSWIGSAEPTTQKAILRFTLMAKKQGWPIPSLTGGDFRGIDLQGAELVGLDLSGTRWKEANLRQLYCEGVCFDGASFQEADLRWATWNQVHAHSVNIEGSDAQGAIFRDVEWSDIYLSNAEFAKVRMIRTEPFEVSSAPKSPSPSAVLLGTGHQGGVQSCAWSPDGERVLSAGVGGTVHLWAVDSGECLAVWKGHQGGVRSCTWSPDGERALSVGKDGTMRLWAVNSGECLVAWKGHQDGVWSCAWSPNGDRALSVGEDGTVRLWAVDSGACLAVWKGHQGGVWSCAWSPDGERALSAGKDGTVRLWTVDSGACLAAWKGHQGGVWSCAWSPNGDRALSAGKDGTVRLWAVDSGACLAVWKGHQDWVISCAWSPDGERALSAGEDGTVRLWAVDSGECLAVWKGHQGGVWSCAWSPDGERALSAGKDGTVRLWAVDSGEGLAVWKGHQDWVRSCSWSPDGERALSAGEDDTVRLWAVDSGACLAVWEVAPGGVRSCAWSPDGKRALSAGGDGTVRLWAIDSGECVAVWKGHQDWVLSCSWSPDGERALSAGSDGTVRLWAVDSGECLAVWKGDQGWLQSCAWSPDGERALSAGDDGTVRLWAVDSGECRQIMAVGRSYSHAVYIPGEGSSRVRVIEASPRAWRWLGWAVRTSEGPERLPAEAYGPLPRAKVHGEREELRPPRATKR